MRPGCLSLVCLKSQVMYDSIQLMTAEQDGVTGHLRLTEAGLQEVGACSLTNFHPHTKEPPLWEEAGHVKEDVSRAVVLKDLR